MNPKISVIVPVYQAEKYLHRCVDSILAQTFTDFEVLLIDDGSRDNSGEICDEYAAIDNRIRVFHIANSGAGAARMFGVKQAVGRWVMFVDSDDTLPVSAVQDLVCSNTANYDITIGTIYFLNQKNTFKHKRVGELRRNEYIATLLLGETSIGPVAKLFKRELFDSLNSIPKHITNNEDLLMLVSLATKVNSIFLSNDIICYNYIYREGSASNSCGMGVDAWFDLFDMMRDALGNLIEQPNVKSSFINYRLKMLYYITAFKGFFLIHSSVRAINFINEIDNIHLNIREKMYLRTISSIKMQKLIFIYNSCFSAIRSLAKSILIRK